MKMTEQHSDAENKWICPGFDDRCPSEEIQFIVQSVTIILIVIVSLYNLTVDYDNNTQLWTSILSCCFGILVPSPGIRRNVSPIPT